MATLNLQGSSILIQDATFPDIESDCARFLGVDCCKTNEFSIGPTSGELRGLVGRLQRRVCNCSTG